MQEAISLRETDGCGGSPPGPQGGPVQTWELEILNLCSRGMGTNLALARAMFAAKRALARHGQWRELWNSGRIPFKIRKGEMLAVIGERVEKVNTQTLARFPTGCSVLYQLTRLAGPTLDQLVLEGIIHPGITLEEAKILVAKLRGHPASGTPQTVRQRVRAFVRYIEQRLSEWPSEQLAGVSSQLAKLIDKLDAATPLLRMHRGSSEPCGQASTPTVTLDHHLTLA